MRRIIGLSILIIFCFITTPYAQMPVISVEVNGSNVVFPDAKPFIDENSRTLVPIRFIAEDLGALVNWFGATKTVQIIKDDKHILLNIGESSATVNSKTVTFDTKAIIKEDRTFVPLRFVSETLGAFVDWVDATKTVIVKTNVEPTQPPQEYYEYEGYTLPVYEASTITTKNSKHEISFEIGIDIDYTKDKNSIDKQIEEVFEILKSRFGEDVSNEIISLIKQKKDRMTGFEAKEFIIDGRIIWVAGAIGSWTVRIVIHKEGV